MVKSFGQTHSGFRIVANIIINKLNLFIMDVVVLFLALVFSYILLVSSINDIVRITRKEKTTYTVTIIALIAISFWTWFYCLVS